MGNFGFPHVMGKDNGGTLIDFLHNLLYNIFNNHYYSIFSKNCKENFVGGA